LVVVETVGGELPVGVPPDAGKRVGEHQSIEPRVVRGCEFHQALGGVPALQQTIDVNGIANLGPAEERAGLAGCDVVPVKYWAQVGLHRRMMQEFRDEFDLALRTRDRVGDVQPGVRRDLLRNLDQEPGCLIRDGEPSDSRRHLALGPFNRGEQIDIVTEFGLTI
jgi:hypothetical protein